MELINCHRSETDIRVLLQASGMRCIEFLKFYTVSTTISATIFTSNDFDSSFVGMCVWGGGWSVMKAWLNEIAKQGGIPAACCRTTAAVSEWLVVHSFPVTSFCEIVLMNGIKRIRKKMLGFMETGCSKHGKKAINGKDICRAYSSVFGTDNEQRIFQTQLPF